MSAQTYQPLTGQSPDVSPILQITVRPRMFREPVRLQRMSPLIVPSSEATDSALEIFKADLSQLV